MRWSCLLPLCSSLAFAQVPAPAPRDAGLIPSAAIVPSLGASASSPSSPQVDRAPELWDVQYAHRGEAAVLAQHQVELATALRTRPQDFEALWRSARLKYWVADAAPDERLKKQLCREAWMLGDRASQANAKRSEGFYWAAVGIGCYSEAVGIIRALSEGLESKFVDRIDAAIRLDETIDNAGPRLVKGRYWYDLPWPKRSLDKSAAELEKALSLQPHNLRAMLYLAETQLKDGEAKKAKLTIDRLLGGSADYDPPEAARVKAQAQPIAADINRELK